MTQSEAMTWLIAGGVGEVVLLVYETVLVVVATVRAVMGRSFRYPLMLRLVR
jgi:uncharacterized Tic20 family protein